MHFHRYTPRKALRMLPRPWRRLAWKAAGVEPVEWTEALTIERPRVTLVVAHPDDEVFCSGLISALAERGAEIALACFTRGEGGATGGAERRQLAALRETELRASAEVLGIGDVRFLDYIDPEPRRGTAREPAHESEQLADDLRAAFESTRPDYVIGHGSSGEYWHPGHILLHDHVRIALPETAKLITFNAFDSTHPMQEIVNEDDRPTFWCDGRPYAERRECALRCHKSQLEVFEHFSKGTVVDFLEATMLERYRIW